MRKQWFCRSIPHALLQCLLDRFQRMRHSLRRGFPFLGRGCLLWPVLLSGARLMLGGIREQEENRLQIIKAYRMRLAARFILFLTPIPSSMYSSPCIFRFPKAHIACLYKLYRIRRTDVC